MRNKCYLADCMDFMKDKPDKYYDLAIVDPPYGESLNLKGGAFTHWRKSKSIGKGQKYGNSKKDWNKKPDKKYFEKLFRISKAQIICGGNYFSLPPTRDFVCFEKIGSGDVLKKLGRSQCEFIWTSFNGLAKIFKWNTNSNTLKKYWIKIHPTQKPVALAKWLLQNYAKPGWKILDTHVGSGYMRIACYDMGFWFEGTEIDPDYWQAQEDRYQAHIANGELFETQEIQKLVYQEQVL